jgi:hypothetical protein
MKFSQTISQVKWLSREKNNISKTISVLVYPEDKDRDGLRNVGFFTAQPFDPADNLRKFHHIHFTSLHVSAENTTTKIQKAPLAHILTRAKYSQSFSFL